MQHLRFINPGARIRRVKDSERVIVEVELINPEDGMVVTSDGQVGQVVHWYDANGIECPPSQACMAMVSVGCGYANIMLQGFITQRLH